MDFEKDVNIDEQALDVECLEQPRITLQYAKWVADMERKKDRAKERVDVVKAELDKDIRNNPDKYGLAKVTEGAVQNTIILQPEYREAQEAYIKAKHESDIAKAAMLSFDCIQCGLCASRCMGELPQYHIAQLARRLYGKYIQPKAEHLKNRVEEIKSGKYDQMLDELTKMDRKELEKRYMEREREPDLATPGTWMPKDMRYL